MFEKIIAFFMSIIYFFLGLFGISPEPEKNEIDAPGCYVYQDMTYGTDERHLLDLVIPQDATGDIGLVLFLHGGAWIAGDKESYNGGIAYCATGLKLAGAAINYRYLSDDIDLNDILDDIDDALTAIKAKGQEHGVNINKVLLTGSSAGGHLSLLYAYARRTTAPITPAAVFSYCGPTDLYDDNFYYNSDLGSTADVCGLMSKACGQTFTIDTKDTAKDALARVSPISYVDENTVPTAICHGKVDKIVPFSNAEAIVEKFETYGVDYDFLIYPNSGHGLDNDPDVDSIASDLIHQYAVEYLK